MITEQKLFQKPHFHNFSVIRGVINSTNLKHTQLIKMCFDPKNNNKKTTTTTTTKTPTPQKELFNAITNLYALQLHEKN